MEKSDFSQHRVLLVGGKSHALLLLRSILTLAGVTQIIHAEDTGRAIALLSMEHFSAVFCEDNTGTLDNMTLPVAARRMKTVLNPMVPIFALQERARRRDVEKARDAGVTDVLTTPISPKTVMTKLRAAPRPFIVAQEFFGPDRRSKKRGPFFGQDRRVRIAKKQKMDFTLV